MLPSARGLRGGKSTKLFKVSPSHGARSCAYSKLCGTAYIQPLINALAPFHKFTIESQILHHAPVKFSPELCDTDRRAWWSVTQAQAGVFVNTEQWTLGAFSVFPGPSRVG